MLCPVKYRELTDSSEEEGDVEAKNLARKMALFLFFLTSPP